MKRLAKKPRSDPKVDPAPKMGAGMMRMGTLHRPMHPGKAKGGQSDHTMMPNQDWTK